MTVHVGHLVDRDTGHTYLDVRAVHGVEAAQEDLRGLALAAVAADVQARHQAQQIVGECLTVVAMVPASTVRAVAVLGTMGAWLSMMTTSPCVMM